jgi:hypothetical protein
VMWNTLHGRLFECTIIGHNYLGDHFTPALLFLPCFYYRRTRKFIQAILGTRYYFLKLIANFGPIPLAQGTRCFFLKYYLCPVLFTSSN